MQRLAFGRAPFLASVASIVSLPTHAYPALAPVAQVTSTTTQTSAGSQSGGATQTQQAAQRASQMKRLALLLQMAPTPNHPFAATSPQSYSAQQVRLSQNVMAWVMSMALPPSATGPRPFLLPGRGGSDLLVRIHVPSTGLDEVFSLFVPDSDPTVARPMLVGFHGFGVSHLDLTFSTSFTNECRNRDWFMLAPLQLSGVGDPQIHYGSAQSQEHVETAIRWVMLQYNVDYQRIYGVGFSMGGGAALSYAARHRDAAFGAFAAIVNHTGSVSTRNTWHNVPQLVQDQMVLLFGGGPGQAPFEYQRSSVVEIDAAGSLVNGGRHMAVNLEATPIRSVYGIADPLGYLVDQCEKLDNYLATLPASNHELVPTQIPSPCFQPGQSPHCWQTLNETETCDWFASKSLDLPERGSLLADESGRWGVLDIVQRSTGAFSSLNYLFEPAINRVILFDRENLDTVRIDLENVSLNAASDITIATRSLDFAPSKTVIAGLPGPPTDVMRGGVAAIESCLPTGLFPTWCYDANDGTLTVNDPDPDLAVWTIIP